MDACSCIVGMSQRTWDTTHCHVLGQEIDFSLALGILCLQETAVLLIQKPQDLLKLKFFAFAEIKPNGACGNLVFILFDRK